jgi:hypothetical protein
MSSIVPILLVHLPEASWRPVCRECPRGAQTWRLSPGAWQPVAVGLPPSQREAAVPPAGFARDLKLSL